MENQAQNAGVDWSYVIAYLGLSLAKQITVVLTLLIALTTQSTISATLGGVLITINIFGLIITLAIIIGIPSVREKLKSLSDSSHNFFGNGKPPTPGTGK